MTAASSAVMTGGEAVVRTLVSNGVRRVFGLPGIQNDWLFNALFDHRDEIEVRGVQCRTRAWYVECGRCACNRLCAERAVAVSDGPDSTTADWPWHGRAA
jgi:acetolactate synthase I/II/III large subunit